MPKTSVTFLEMLRQHAKPEAWQQLVDLYTPYLQGCLRPYGLKPEDADDIIQEVLTVIVRELQKFQHNRRPGAFRRWLRTVMVNRLRMFWRSRKAQPVATGNLEFLETLTQLEDHNSEQSQRWDQEHDRYVIRQLVERIQEEFQPATVQAFQRIALDEADPEDVAAELGVSVNAVLISKCRVFNRLRQLAQGLIDHRTFYQKRK